MPAGQRDEKQIKWWKSCKICGGRFEDSMTTFLDEFPMRVKDFKVDIGKCTECTGKEHRRYETLLYAAALHSTFESAKKYFTDHPPILGQELLILDTSGGGPTYTYALVKVVNPEHTKQRRIVTDGYTNGYSGQSFYRTGRNCFAPKGQVRLLPYNSTIGDLIKKSGHNEIYLEPEKVMALIGEIDPPASKDGLGTSG